MQHYADNVQDRFGNGVTGAAIRVLTSTGAVAAIYSDNGVTPKANPITAAANGTFDFYAANGTYTISSGGGSQTVTLFDLSDATAADLKQDEVLDWWSFKRWSPNTSGGASTGVKLNDAFTESAAAGAGLLVTPGRYLVDDSTLKLVSGLRVKFAPGAILLNRVPSTGTHGFIEQADLTTKISDVLLRGIRVSGLNATNSKGNVFCLYGDDIRVEDPWIDGFGGNGRVALVSGDRMRFIRGKAINPFGGSGSGGIRVAGGDAFLCDGMYVHSGDDVFQFVTGEDNTGPASFYNQDITNGTYANCYGVSDTARVIIAQVNDAITSMSANLKNVRFNNCSGVSAGTGGTIFLGGQTAYGLGHSGVIRDIKVVGGYYECTSASGTTPLATLCGTAATAGVVSSIELHSVAMRPGAADAETLRFSGVQKGAKVRNCTVYANTNGAATASTVNIFQGDDVEITGGTVYQGTATIALKTPNAVGRACTGLSVSGVEFKDCHDSVVYDNYATSSLYVANKFRKLSGGASATAITTTVNSVNCKARASTFDGIETPYSNSGTGAELFGDDSTGTFTPTITFTTAGDLNPGYTLQSGVYTKTNNIVTFRIEIDFTPTYTTAAGNFRLGGLPYTAKNDGTYVGGGSVVSQTSNLSYGAGYTAVAVAAVHNQTYLHLAANGSGKNTSVLSVTNITSGTAQSLIVAGYYLSAT